MLGSYVCRQCRTRLLHRAPSIRPLRWQPRATFISLRNAGRDPTATADEPALPNKSHDAVDGAPNSSAIPDHTHLERRSSRYSKHLRLPTTESSGEAGLEDEPTSRLAPLLIEYETQHSAGNVLLRRLLEAGDVNGAWDHVQRTYSGDDALLIQQTQNPRLLKWLLDMTVQTFCKGEQLAATPTAVLLRYHQLGFYSDEAFSTEEPSAKGRNTLPDSFRDTLRGLTSKLLLLTFGTQHDTAQQQRILAELLSVWRLLFQCRGPGSVSLKSPSTQWEKLPNMSTLNPALMPARGFVERLQAHHPKLMGHATIAFSAVVTFGLLHQPSRYGLEVGEKLESEAKPFITFLAHILSGANVKSVIGNLEHLRVLEQLPEEARNTLVEMVHSAPLDATISLGREVPSDAPAEKPARLSAQEQRLAQEQKLLKRIARAVHEQRQKNRLEHLWNEAVRTYTNKKGKITNPPATLPPATIPPAVYNEFLSGFLTLLAADRSVEVWNHMIASGVKPDVRTWTAMLTGCAKSRDLDGLQKMWDRMVRTGVKPDNHAWTTRVNGLISLHRVQDGFAALDEMGKLWQNAQNSTNAGANGTTEAVNMPPKPSAEVVNGAASAIVQSRGKGMTFERKAEYIGQILSWARSYSIRPDARTYNILIQLHLSGGDYATAFKLLNQMEKDGIEHDMATYTMLIRASFDNKTFSGLSAEEQAESVLSLLSDLEAGGLKLNSYVYSIVIDRLLKEYHNFNAVGAVVNHMLSRGLEPNPHIYTSLVTHHLQQTPPDIDAVDGLWFRILRLPGAATDKVLFDRIIEGYASVGEVGKMMAVLTQMSRHGKLPGWVALSAVVKALASAGDWERARNVVRDVQNGEGVAKGGITGNRHGHDEFLQLVDRLGILGPDSDNGLGRAHGWDGYALEGDVAEPVIPRLSESGGDGGELVESRTGQSATKAPPTSAS